MIFQTVKSEEDDARRKEITLLLAADNIDDESQMDMALHGELAGKIVEQIFEQVSKGSCDINIFIYRLSIKNQSYALSIYHLFFLSQKLLIIINVIGSEK